MVLADYLVYVERNPRKVGYGNSSREPYVSDGMFADAVAAALYLLDLFMVLRYYWCIMCFFEVHQAAGVVAVYAFRMLRSEHNGGRRGGVSTIITKQKSFRQE